MITRVEILPMASLRTRQAMQGRRVIAGVAHAYLAGEMLPVLFLSSNGESIARSTANISRRRRPEGWRRALDIEGGKSGIVARAAA